MKSAALVFAILMFAAPAFGARQIIGGEQDHSIAQVGDCDDFFKTVFTTFPAGANDQEQREISLTGVDRLRVTASQEGGVSVRGWSRPNARLIVCRSAVAQTRAHAERVLAQIKVRHANGEITAQGPTIDDHQTWWVNFILYVPRRAAVDVRAANGGVAIRNMDGQVTAHATTGGISVAQGAGNFKITTESGGITLERLSGRVEAASTDGAIAFRVPGGGVPALEAHIQDEGEIRCHLERCENGLGSWAPDRKTLRIGTTTPSVKLSTSGAAIIIDNVR